MFTTDSFFQSDAARVIFYSGWRIGQFNSSTLRQQRVRQATPSWADKSALKAIYAECKRLNEEYGSTYYHVDHIIPIKGELVCGLHAPDNLRIVPHWINSKKHTSFLGSRKNPTQYWKFQTSRQY